ncbi:MAG: hypothetical protein U5O39_11715 [Gammaproteobacteria bacterium]|nr:hypothetical protein [Gammaproteobacteria bacterium]
MIRTRYAERLADATLAVPSRATRSNRSRASCLPTLEQVLADSARRSLSHPVASQIGSGALPLEVLPGFALVLTPGQGTDGHLQKIASALRAIPHP